MVVVSNFTLPNDVVIDKKGRYFDALSFLLCFMNKAKFVKNFVYVKIYIIYIYENAFECLLNKFNEKFFKK